jgi:hypothetical protein
MQVLRVPWDRRGVTPGALELAAGGPAWPART